MESSKDLIRLGYLSTVSAEIVRFRKTMESIEASLVSLGSWTTDSWYALVPRPLPDRIPGECAVTGEIMVFKEIASDAKIEAYYNWDNLYNGWIKKEGE